MMSKKQISILFIRHGMRQDFQNPSWRKEHPEHRYDPPLSAQGRKQAKSTGRYLREEVEAGRLPPVRHIFASPYHRTLETSSAIAHEIGQHSLVKVEGGLGEWFGLQNANPPYSGQYNPIELYKPQPRSTVVPEDIHLED